jgi:diguanylate cyclase (GGDEF)-like protein
VHLGAALASIALLMLAAGEMWILPWQRLPEWLTVVVPVTVVAFAVTLILATGDVSSGIGVIILLPLVWTALYHRRWESFVVIGAIAVSEVILSLIPMQVSDAVLVRKVASWTVLGLLIAIATHELRDRLRRSSEQREEQLQRNLALAEGAHLLTTALDPQEVLVIGTRLAAEAVSPVGTRGRRAQYNRIQGDAIEVTAQYDETGMSITTPFPLAEQPNLVEVLQTGVTTQLRVEPEKCGPIVRELASSLHITNSVYIPVRFRGVIDGILSVPMRGREATAEEITECVAIGHLLELALGNAYEHTALEHMAKTDALTGLPNRAAFEQLISDVPAGQHYSMMAIDLDDLKFVNDTLGHAAGDKRITQVARAVQGALRGGDAVARIGGDEFAVLLLKADRQSATDVAERILARVQSMCGAPDAGISIGIATGDDRFDHETVLNAADRAMYEAKQYGGSRFAVATL